MSLPHRNVEFLDDHPIPHGFDPASHTGLTSDTEAMAEQVRSGSGARASSKAESAPAGSELESDVALRRHLEL